MYYLERGHAKHLRFRNAVLLAIVIHAICIIAISFSAPEQRAYSPQIEVTLATRPSSLAPDDATHIAQASQAGSGVDTAVNQVSSEIPLPARGGSPPSLSRTDATRESSRGAVTTKAMAADSNRQDASAENRPPVSLDGISPEVDRLNSELASLEAQLDEQTLAYASQPRVRRLTSTAAKQSVDAAYLLDWRRRLEAVGNRYYPEASLRYGIFGKVRLLVVVRSDGSLEDIRVLSSSGYAVLDEAAIKVVRMAAPFAPFPEELKATTDKLEIVRTWHYEENSLSSN